MRVRRESGEGRAVGPVSLLLAFALLFLAAVRAYALGLGDMVVRSALNEPLDATVPLLGVRPEAIGDIEVGLANPELFARQGVPYAPLLGELEFTVTGAGRDSIEGSDL